MLQKIENEINRHCYQCSMKDNCNNYDCIAFRIKNIVKSTFDSSNIDIDEFFEKEDKSQTSIFDYFDKEE